jgi:hypothetical protein
MYAIITDGSISNYVNNPRPLVIGDVQYPAKIFSVWTASELAAIGIIEVTYDYSNKKDEKWYINTNQTFTYDASAGTVTATYGTATAKAHADVNWTQQQIDDGKAPEGADTNTVATRGLKYNLIQSVKSQASNLLNQTDWYITRNTEKSTEIPSNITTWRDGIRSKQAAMETAITNASDTPALETLYTYTQQVDSDKVISAITKANPAVVTCNSHGYSNGDSIIISEVVGMTEVNGKTFIIAEKTTNTFELQDVNSSSYTTYNSAGVSNKFNGTFTRPLGEFPELGS